VASATCVAAVSASQQKAPSVYVSPAAEKNAMPGQARAAAKPSGAEPSSGAAQSQSSLIASQPVLPLTSDQVAAHLGETVDWFHHLGAMEQQPIAAADMASRDKLHQQSLTAVELALDFGKACAVLLDEQSRQSGANTSNAANTSTVASKGFAGRLDQAAANVAQRVDSLQSKLATLNEQTARARGKERATLAAQQGQVSAALRLAREVQGSVQDMEDFESSSIAGDSGNLSPLDGQIIDIERSVPEAHAKIGSHSSSIGRASGSASSSYPSAGSPGGG